MSANAQFEDMGLTWSAPAPLGEAHVVVPPDGTGASSRFLHGIHLHAARKALDLVPPAGVVLDFGCGMGRFLRYFGRRGHPTIGAETAHAVLDHARRLGLPAACRMLVTDGVHLPLKDASVDMVWISGVRRLCPHDATRYQEIAGELHRVLKPCSHVVNLEICVDLPPTAFNLGFERAGFATRDVRVLHRYGCWDRFFESSWMPQWGTALVARMYAALRYQLDVANSSAAGPRDYLFLWQKRTKAESSLLLPIDQQPIGVGQC